MAAAVGSSSSSDRVIRWGICGTGTIASDFVTVLKHLPATEVAAVGSRSKESADKFGDRFEIPVRHASYAALAQDASLDIIYVGPRTIDNQQPERLEARVARKLTGLPLPPSLPPSTAPPPAALQSTTGGDTERSARGGQFDVSGGGAGRTVREGHGSRLGADRQGARVRAAARVSKEATNSPTNEATILHA